MIGTLTLNGTGLLKIPSNDLDDSQNVVKAPTKTIRPKTMFAIRFKLSKIKYCVILLKHDNGPMKFEELI